MDKNQPNMPVVMCFSASDPSGGAGIQADIEVLGSIGCHCSPIITAVTAQDTKELYQLYACPSQLVVDQAHAVMEDLEIQAIKIGLVGSVENVRAIHQLLVHYPKIPVILDPAILEGNANKHIDPAIIEAIEILILPRVSVCTVNANEAKLFAQEADTIDACAQELMAREADYILITDTTSDKNKISNTLYGNYRKLETFQWERLPYKFQGAGCTLSTAIAGLMAQGLPASSATHQAQHYTNECLKSSYKLGMGYRLPNRLYWARNSFAYDSFNKAH
jgi:hydroxymethylpyrimidine/phosphomethylpyrimidine kinase